MLRMIILLILPTSMELERLTNDSNTVMFVILSVKIKVHIFMPNQ